MPAMVRGSKQHRSNLQSQRMSICWVCLGLQGPEVDTAVIKWLPHANGPGRPCMPLHFSDHVDAQGRQHMFWRMFHAALL